MVRKKHVTRKARGKGKCPKQRSKKRYGKKKCNRHACFGDEECLAKQDVILAIDGSGSVKKNGFKVLQEFASGLVEKFRGTVEDWVYNEVTGTEEEKEVTAVQTAVIQFGQGVLKKNNTVGGADIIQEFVANRKTTATSIRELEWRKGFTNMAQAFMAADTVFLNGGRKHAQSIVIVISDGKPSFKFQTSTAVAKLRRKGVKVVMVVVKEFLKEDQKHMLQQWSSVPRHTNFVHIPGLKDLKENTDFWINQVLIRSCSKTISLKKEWEEQERWETADALEELAEFGDEPGAETSSPAPVFLQK